MFEEIMPFLPFIIPLVIIQLGLMLVSVVHVIRHDTFRVGNKVIWLLVCILGQMIGPILYFTIGKGDE
ncbi:MAG: PLDc N-terminal domain-containing protein [Defluviitaleaceae bacterium]|nr:PLDc N-terminal domain-containing protein [Defluviitaleaceae bacterium]MCL2273675.1 PLDc N-terminal domain-containing protein [Defluviitaleaceae bacterium]